MQLNAQYHEAEQLNARQEWADEAAAPADGGGDESAGAADAAEHAPEDGAAREEDEWGDGWGLVVRGPVERAPDQLWLNVPQLAPGRRCAQAR